VVDVGNVGNVWRTFHAGDVSLRSLYIPFSTKIEKNALRKDGWQFEPGIAESWGMRVNKLEYENTRTPPPPT
jgi:hypothetical protein